MLNINNLVDILKLKTVTVNALNLEEHYSNVNFKVINIDASDFVVLLDSGIFDHQTIFVESRTIFNEVNKLVDRLYDSGIFEKGGEIDRKEDIITLILQELDKKMGMECCNVVYCAYILTKLKGYDIMTLLSSNFLDEVVSNHVRNHEREMVNLLKINEKSIHEKKCKIKETIDNLSRQEFFIQLPETKMLSKLMESHPELGIKDNSNLLSETKLYIKGKKTEYKDKINTSVRNLLILESMDVKLAKYLAKNSISSIDELFYIDGSELLIMIKGSGVRKYESKAIILKHEAAKLLGK